MARKMLVADLLCGAGGSSTGAKFALDELGLEMELVCLNHWPTAIETHKRNHPEARHYVQDIATVRPHLIVPEGYLDLLMASPTCTHHSVARGGKPTSDQQRSDPWHIITWLTELRVKRIIIENVWEFCGWGPVDPRTGKPIKARKGEYFHAWIETIKRLNFEPEFRKLNASDYGEATTRQRFILMARSDGRRLIWPVPTHAKLQAADKLASIKKEIAEQASLFEEPVLQPWRPAREIIDWTKKGKSIFRRKKPLAPKTLTRIYAGAVKFGWPQPFLDLLKAEIERSLLYTIGWAFQRRNKPKKKGDRGTRRKFIRETVTRLRIFRVSPNDFVRARRAEPLVVTLRRNATGASTERPLPAIAAEGQHIAIAEPIIVNMKGRSTASASGEPMPTQTAHAPHLFAAEPIVCGNRTNNTAKPVSEPVGGITTTTGGGQFLAEPVFINGRKNNEAKGVSTDPLPTLDTKGGVWIAEAFTLSTGSNGAPRSTSEPISCLTTGGAGSEDPGCARPMLVEGFVVSAAHGVDPGEQDPHSRRAKSLDDPLGAIHAGGGSFGVVEPFILNRHGDGRSETRAHSVEEPAPTANCDGGGYLVEPFMLSRQGGGAPRSLKEPTPTQAAKHSHILISPYYGSGSGETCTSGDDPLPSPTTKARFGMIVPVTNSNGGAQPRDVDVDPIGTMTTAKGGEFALVMPVTHDDGSNRARDVDVDPLPGVTGANRGELAFITAQHGEREGQAPRVHSVGNPAPTIAATGHVDLVEGTPEYDILFRMLEPPELAAAMGLEDYDFAGNKTEQIKQIGNAVSRRKMQACVKAIMGDAAPKRRAEFREAAE